MYRPLRDLNGIPGAKNLIMCLTGYQRQDRDDIMVCVAHFVSFHEHLGMK
jgi:topoisomerase (DNA) II binding protein 1